MLLMASCHFTFNSLNLLKKGQTIEEVSDVVAKAPENTFKISLPSDSKFHYVVEQYKVEDGIQVVFFCVYRDGKLFYWGYPYELNRHHDTTISEIGIAATNAYNRTIK